jgi:hypothetical protein
MYAAHWTQQDFVKLQSFLTTAEDRTCCIAKSGCLSASLFDRGMPAITGAEGEWSEPALHKRSSEAAKRWKYGCNSRSLPNASPVVDQRRVNTGPKEAHEAALDPSLLEVS